VGTQEIEQLEEETALVVEDAHDGRGKVDSGWWIVDGGDGGGYAGRGWDAEGDKADGDVGAPGIRRRRLRGGS
jgi:hypothetical protein